jgi:hypothetical protein
MTKAVSPDAIEHAVRVERPFARVIELPKWVIFAIGRWTAILLLCVHLRKVQGERLVWYVAGDTARVERSNGGTQIGAISLDCEHVGMIARNGDEPATF